MGKEPLRRAAPMTGLSNIAVMARDFAQWLEDREVASVQDRDLARRRLERRTGIPRGVFWASRYRARESIGRYLDRLIEARLHVIREDVRELENTIAAARLLGRPDLRPEIEAAESDLGNARRRLAALRTHVVAGGPAGTLLPARTDPVAG